MLQTLDRLESFWDYREFFRARMRSMHRQGGAGEGEQDYLAAAEITPLNERLIQTIWASQLLRGEGLKTAGGDPVRVLDPGRWNGAAGPDFQAARIMLGERLVSGDVEIHLRASEWREHKHDGDLDYNGVALHVVFQIDDGAAFDRLHNGRELPRLELEPYVFPDIETLRRSVTPDDYLYARPASIGRCHDLMVESDAAMVASFLDRAGDERLASKVRRLEDQAASADLDQVAYQAIMMALGSGPSKPLYYLLAKRAPRRELLDYAGELDAKDRRNGIEAILLHVAGLVPAEGELEGAPEESRAHARVLAGLWKRFEPFWSDRAMAPTRRWYRGLRPVNFPARRIAAMSSILARSLNAKASMIDEIRLRILAGAASLGEAKPAKRIHPLLRDLFRLFEVDDPSSFWSNHFSFSARPSARKSALIGEGTARSIVFNAVLPVILLAARSDGDEALAEAAGRLYSIFPPLQANHVTEFMARRLFGDGERAAQLLTTERRQQGLFQIFYSCCNGESSHCDSCFYLSDSRRGVN